MTYDDAVRPDAPTLWDEAASNRSFEWEGGDAAAVDQAFAAAAHVTRLDLVNHRIVAAFMEPRGALAELEEGYGRLGLDENTSELQSLLVNTYAIFCL